jgi:hypothetical protein
MKKGCYSFLLAMLLFSIPAISLSDDAKHKWKYVVKSKHYIVHCDMSQQFAEEAAKMAEAAFDAASTLLNRTYRDPRFIKTIEYNFPKKAKFIKEVEGTKVYEMPGGVTIEEWWLFMTRYTIKLPDGRSFEFYEPSKEGKKVNIYMYNSQKEYKQNDPMNELGISSGAGGWSAGEGKISYGLIDGKGFINLNILIHEIMHQVLSYVLFNEPTWLDEGLAEFAGVSDMGVYSPGLIRYDRLTRCYNAILAGTFIPARKLMTMDFDKFHVKDKETLDLHYAESWALVNFLVLSKHPQIKGKFPKYFTELRKGNDPIKSFKKIYDINIVERELVNAIVKTATTPVY